jgi:hypothetical protein
MLINKFCVCEIKYAKVSSLLGCSDDDRPDDGGSTHI